MLGKNNQKGLSETHDYRKHNTTEQSYLYNSVVLFMYYA